jgi:hypothetical protein
MALVPRVVVVSRKTVLQGLLERHGTRAAVRFFLAARGQELDRVQAAHDAFEQALATVLAALPRPWRRTRVARDDLERFLFEPEDLVVAIGQDGLVANVAKYLTGQPVVGIAPDPSCQPGVLARHDAAGGVGRLLRLGNTGRGRVEQRTMVEATLDDGQVLRALNEVFVGHRTHQSARYRIQVDERIERQSSSGVLITTGTGATGWASSVHRQRRCDVRLPAPEEDRLAFFVREAWASPTTGCAITEGPVGEALRITSEMPESGVVFGDGIEADALAFGWGQTVTLTTSAHRLSLVA